MRYQANTGFNSNQGSNALTSPVGNWVIDGVNDVLGTIATGVSIYGDVVDTKTRNEIDLLNAKAQSNSQSPQPINQTVVQDNQRLEQIMAIVGVTMIVFAGAVLWFSKGK